MCSEDKDQAANVCPKEKRDNGGDGSVDKVVYAEVCGYKIEEKALCQLP